MNGIVSNDDLPQLEAQARAIRALTSISSFHEGEVDLEEGLSSNDNGLVVRRTLAGVTKDIKLADVCAICLEKYAVGEVVSWSLNEGCSHVYHEACVAHYFALALKKGKECLCPSCRRIYCTPAEDDGQEVCPREQLPPEAQVSPDSSAPISA
jgi:hypothetical protein